MGVCLELEVLHVIINQLKWCISIFEKIYMCMSCNLQHQHHVKNEINTCMYLLTQNKFSLVYCVPRLHYCYKYYSTHTPVPVPPHTQVHRKGTRKSFPRHLPFTPTGSSPTHLWLLSWTCLLGLRHHNVPTHSGYKWLYPQDRSSTWTCHPKRSRQREPLCLLC